MKQDRKAEMACTHYTPPITSSDKPLHVALALKGLHQAAAATDCSTGHRHRGAATLGEYWQRRSAPLGTSVEGLLRCGVLSATDC